jgi:hypothetical protein
MEEAVSKKLSRHELIEIVHRLMSQRTFRRTPEEFDLLHKFEDNVPYHYAADLIMHYKHEFKDAAELVDFALGQEKVPKLSREELITVARKLMTADLRNDVESQRLGTWFTKNVPHPDGEDLIFYPKIEFKSPEDLVDYALSYKGPKQRV